MELTLLLSTLVYCKREGNSFKNTLLGESTVVPRCIAVPLSRSRRFVFFFFFEYEGALCSSS